MARYEFRCRACGDTFEVSRPMAQASDPATCPSGHDDTVKLISAVAVNVGAAGGRGAASEVAPSGGGGCCGGGCCG